MSDDRTDRGRGRRDTLSRARPAPPLDALHPARRLRRRPRGARSWCAARAPTSGTSTASATSTGWPGSSPARSATAGPSWPRRRPSRPPSWPTSRCGPTPTRGPSSWPSGCAGLTPGRPQPGLLHLGRLRGGRVGLEAGPPVLPGRSASPYADQGHQPRHRLPRHHHGRPLDHRHPGAEDAVRAARARSHQGAQHQLLPGPRARRRPRGLRPVGGRRDRAGHRARGPRHGGRRLPRAGAERRRLLPAAARLLRAGPRDLRPPRRAARLRRGHLRLRPARASGSAPTATATSPTSSPWPRG